MKIARLCEWRENAWCEKPLAGRTTRSKEDVQNCQKGEEPSFVRDKMKEKGAAHFADVRAGERHFRTRVREGRKRFFLTIQRG